MGDALESIDRSDVGCVRTARKPWRCVCADPVRRYEVRYDHEPAGSWTSSIHRTRQDAERALGEVTGRFGNGRIDEVANPNYRPDCLGDIAPGDRYFEDISDSEPYQHGPAYCARCAVGVWGKHS